MDTPNAVAVPTGLATVREAAAFLAVARSTLYCLMDANKLAFVKIGKARRIRWSDLEQFVQTHLIGS